MISFSSLSTVQITTLQNGIKNCGLSQSEYPQKMTKSIKNMQMSGAEC